MHAFIIRPFNVKDGIDFERVEKELIDPALRDLDIGGRTTGEIARAGNIREDMFELLLTADLVIADISIHNANVFYELGIRHAFCDKYTYLIRCGAHEVPFDLKTDRYLEYERDDPAAAVPRLLAGLRETLDSGRQDSPLFLLLPRLEPQDRSRLLVVPAEFREEVRRAEADGHIGDLGLLAEEARRFRWALEGLRTVGVAQFEHGAFDAARITWEQVRGYDGYDLEANRRLATIYGKLGDLTRSDQAVVRVLESQQVGGAERAEFQSLLASNAKTRWTKDWEEREGTARELALRSPWLEVAHQAYSDGFAADRNHFYSGLNALALLTVRIELGRSLPNVWSENFETAAAAMSRLDELAAEREKLAAAVDLAMLGSKKRLEFERRHDRWLDISLADFACLVSTSPGRVASLYRNALKDAPSFYLTAARRQLAIYRALAVLTENADAALAVIDERLSGARGGSVQRTPSHVLLFTGHRMDAPSRASPRFPAPAEGKARAMIRQAVDAELQIVGGELIGYAGGASGGDILFHEVCAELGIRTQLLLAAPRSAYVHASVQDAGADWVARFDRLHAALPTRVLGDSLELPRWLRSLENYSIWQRTNLWLLHNALVHNASRMTLIALWNGEGGDGPGGTEHMVEEARQRGARTVVLDACELLEQNP